MKRSASLYPLKHPNEPDEPEESGEGGLESMTVAELKALADERGVEYPSDIRKSELIELLGGE